MRKFVSLFLAIVMMMSCLTSFSFAGEEAVTDETEVVIAEGQVAESEEEEEPAPKENTPEEKPEDKPKDNPTNEGPSNQGQTTEDQGTEGQPAEGQGNEGQGTEGQGTEGQTVEGEQPKEQQEEGTDVPSVTKPDSKPEEEPEQPEENTAILTVSPAEATPGEDVTFTVETTGEKPVRYDWQYRELKDTDDDSAWQNASDASGSSNEYTVCASDELFGRQYRCKVSYSSGSLYTDPKTVTPKESQMTEGQTNEDEKPKEQQEEGSDVPSATEPDTKPEEEPEQPEENTAIFTVSPIAAAPGENVTFTVETTGEKPVSYGWQYRAAEDGDWIYVDGVSGSTYTVISDEVFGRQYRCKVSYSTSSPIYTDPKTVARKQDSEIDVNGLLGGASSFTVTVSVSPNVVDKTDSMTMALTGIGETVKFTATPKSATGTIKYQWQYRVNQGSWKNTTLTGNATKTLTVKVTADMINKSYEFRCLVTAGNGKVYSETVAPAPAHIPVLRFLDANQNNILSSANFADGWAGIPGDNDELNQKGLDDVVYLQAQTSEWGTGDWHAPDSTTWQYSTDNGQNWKAVTAAQGETLGTDKLKVTINENTFGLWYRCQVIWNNHKIYTYVPLKIEKPFVVTLNPIVGGVGEIVTLSASQDFDPEGAVSYKWEGKHGNEGWGEEPFSTQASPRFEINENDYDGNTLFRCKMTVNGVSMYSDPVTVERPFTVELTTNPANGKAGLDTEATITATPSKEGDAEYRWQCCAPGCEPVYIEEDAEAGIYTTLDTFTIFQVTDQIYTLKYRCVVNIDDQMVYSPWKSFAKPFTATVAVSPAKAAIGTSVTLTVTPKNTKGTLKYAWQYSTDGGETWKNLTAAGSTRTKNKAVFKMTEALLNAKYRCLVTDSKLGKITSAVKTVGVPFTVNAYDNANQENDFILTGTGKTVKVTAKASSGTSGTLTYQWYYRCDGKGWTKATWTNNAKATMSVKVTDAMLTKHYSFRCLVTATNGKMYSNPVNLLKAFDSYAEISDDVGIGEYITMTAGVEQPGVYTYQWQEENYDGTWRTLDDTGDGTYAGTSTSQMTLRVDEFFFGMSYRCLVTADDETANAVPTNTVTVGRPFTVKVNPIVGGVGETVYLCAAPVGSSGSATAWMWQRINPVTNELEDYSDEESPAYTIEDGDFGAASFRCLLTADGHQVDSNFESVQKPFEVSLGVNPAKAGWTKDVTFTATPDKEGETYYQWFVKRNNGDWEPIEDAEEQTYTVKVVEKTYTEQYRCLVTVDGQSVFSPAKKVGKPFTATVSSSPSKVVIGTSVTLTVNPKSTKGTLTYLWQYSTDGGESWKTLTAAGSTKSKNKAVFTMTEELLDAQFRCRVKDSTLGTIASTPKTLAKSFTVEATPPERKAGIGQAVDYTAVITGTATKPKYQWYYMVDGAGWKKATWSGNASKKMTVTVTDEMLEKHYLFRCLVTATEGKMYSNPVALNKEFEVYALANNLSAGIGQEVNMWVDVPPDRVCDYIWQYREPDGEWTSLMDQDGLYSGVTTGVMTVTVQDFTYNYEFRCLASTQVTGEDDTQVTVTVPSVTLWIDQPFTVTVNPIIGGIGEPVTLSAFSDSEGIPGAWLWQKWSDELPGWGYLSSDENPVYTVEESDYGTARIRCLMTVSGVKVNSAEVTVEKPFTVKVTSTKAGIGAKTTLKAAVTGLDSTEGLAYQWQISKKKGAAGSWTDMTGKTAASFEYTLPTAFNYENYRFRCIVTKPIEGEEYGQVVISGAVSVARPYTVKVSPTSKKADSGKVTFTVTVSGTVTYQWQYSEDGGTTWKSSTDTGAKTKAVTLTVSNAVYRRLYRCLVTVNKVKNVCQNVYVEPTYVTDFDLVENGEGYWEVTGYTGAGGAVKVPAGHLGRKVVAIADGVFMNNTAITTVTIPQKVTAIGVSAFEGCTGLTTVTLSDDVAEIGEAAFKNCSSLSNMKISNK